MAEARARARRPRNEAASAACAGGSGPLPTPVMSARSTCICLLSHQPFAHRCFHKPRRTPHEPSRFCPGSAYLEDVSSIPSFGSSSSVAFASPCRLARVPAPAEAHSLDEYGDVPAAANLKPKDDQPAPPAAVELGIGLPAFAPGLAGSLCQGVVCHPEKQG